MIATKKKSEFRCLWNPLKSMYSYAKKRNFHFTKTTNGYIQVNSRSLARIKMFQLLNDIEFIFMLENDVVISRISFLKFENELKFCKVLNSTTTTTTTKRRLTFKERKIDLLSQNFPSFKLWRVKLVYCLSNFVIYNDHTL